MSDADALLAAVLAEPDADIPRLVFADHLDDLGDHPRAEFIRIQCALAAGPDSLPLRIREQTLLHFHREKWLAPLRARGEPLHGPAAHGRFRRGFVEEVWMPADLFVARSAGLFARSPVRSLRVTGQSHDFYRKALARHPDLGRLRALALPGPRGDDWAFFLLTETMAGGLPAVLNLRNVGLTDAGVGNLALVGTQWRPTELDVSLNPLTEAGLNVLRARFGTAVRFDR